MYQIQGRSQPHSRGWARVPLSSFFLKFWSIFVLFLKLSSLFWLSGWASRPPGKALATPLIKYLIVLPFIAANIIGKLARVLKTKHFYWTSIGHNKLFNTNCTLLNCKYPKHFFKSPKQMPYCIHAVSNIACFYKKRHWDC